MEWHKCTVQRLMLTCSGVLARERPGPGRENMGLSGATSASSVTPEHSTLTLLSALSTSAAARALAWLLEEWMVVRSPRIRSTSLAISSFSATA